MTEPLAGLEGLAAAVVLVEAAEVLTTVDMVVGATEVAVVTGALAEALELV